MAVRKPITTLYWHARQEGSGRLLASTDEKVFILSAESGNWTQILSLGERPGHLGFGERRFDISSVGDVTFLSNPTSVGFVYRHTEKPKKDSAGVYQYAQAVADLIVLGVSEIGCSCAHGGFVFIANITIEGERKPSSIYWSDYNNPEGWIPGGESLAGFIDLGKGQTVLAMKSLGEQLIIYTDAGIYAATMTNAPEVWRFRNRYDGPNVPLYPRAIVDAGDFHVYMGKDNVWWLDTRMKEPQYYQWLHDASGAMYKGVPASLLNGLPAGIMQPFEKIDEAMCYAACGGYDERRRLAWFSWTSRGHDEPNISLVLNPVHNTASLYDHGFTAFISAPTGVENPNLTLRGWAHTRGICEATVGVNEGDPCAYPPFVQSQWRRLYHTEELTPGIFYDTDDPNTEDIDETLWPEPPTTDSWCYNEGEILDCIPCEGEWKFLMASSVDRTIKEYTPLYVYRELAEDDPDALTPPEWCNEPLSLNARAQIDEDRLSGNHPTLDYDDADYRRETYASLWQSDSTKMAKELESIVAGVRLHGAPDRPGDLVPADWPPAPWEFQVQVGTGQSASCGFWANDDAQIMCLPWEAKVLEPWEDATDAMTFRFNERGLYGVIRFFASGSNPAKNTGVWAANALTVSVVNGTCKWV